jgi:mRNA-degrading endonuclease RelE of RelBE toxin-antitoxin system
LGKDEPETVRRKVFLTKHCERAYKKLQESVKRTVQKTIDEISLNPRLGYPLNDRRFKEQDLYSIHCGDFRIIYQFSHNPGELEIWAVAHRSHVYEELERYRSVSS